MGGKPPKLQESAQAQKHAQVQGAFKKRMIHVIHVSAIHKTFSQLAAFFIVTRAKRSVVMSFVFLQTCPRHAMDNLRSVNKSKYKMHLGRARARKIILMIMLHTPHADTEVKHSTTKKAPRQSAPTKAPTPQTTLIMIQPQVHLRLPCYDF